MSKPGLLFARVMFATLVAVACHDAVAQVPRANAAEAKVALVIGNGTYLRGPLLNPVNDAQDVAKRLEELGFRVILRLNSTQRQIKQSVREFSSALRGADVGLFFYAGHGVQSRGRNYLIPIGADIQYDYEVEDEAVDANLIIAAMEDAQTRVSVVILDACRDNPFGKSSRSTGGGLAQMDAAKGMLIAFATSPGSVASDGIGRNGTYTKHLLLSLSQPDTEVERVFKHVAQGVSKETTGKQVPWISSSLTGDFYFVKSAPKAISLAQDSEVASPIPIAAGEPLLVQIEILFWDTIKSSSMAEDFDEYLKQYPSGRFAGLARNRINAFRKTTQ